MYLNFFNLFWIWSYLAGWTFNVHEKYFLAEDGGLKERIDEELGRIGIGISNARPVGNGYYAIGLRRAADYDAATPQDVVTIFEKNRVEAKYLPGEQFKVGEFGFGKPKKSFR